MANRHPMPLRYRFWLRVRVRSPNDCWLWTGSVGNKGYGYYGWNDKRGHWERAHRIAWRLTRSEIPPGLHVDHMCRTRLCCNPRHMQLLTPAEHARKSSSEAWGTIGDDDTCRHGHEGERYRRKDGSIRCRACKRAEKRREPRP
jgi:hypothetical protein